MADDKKPAFTTVIALRPDTSGHNLLLKVLEAKLIERPPRPPPGKAQRLAECTVGDETGVIFLTAHNEQGERPARAIAPPPARLPPPRRPR
jgi:replication factor A1